MSGGIVKDFDCSEQGCHGIDHPELDIVADDEPAHDEANHPEQALCRVEDGSFGESVDNEAAPCAEEQNWQRLQGRDETQGRARTGQLQYQQPLCNRLHPSPRLGNPLADEEESIIADSQGGEGALTERTDAHHWSGRQNVNELVRTATIEVRGMVG